MDVEKINVRFARAEDVDWCMQTLAVGSKALMAQKAEDNEMIVAELDGVLVGVLELQYLWEGHGLGVPYMSTIIVLNQYQRQGVGRSMLRFFEDYLKDKGCEILLCSSQLDELPPQEWHRHMGFEECGILNGINEGGVGEVFFRKEL